MGKVLTAESRAKVLKRFQVEFPTIQISEQSWDDENVPGVSVPSKSLVYINSELDMDIGDYVSTLCHEICHIELYREGSFLKYHQFFDEDTHMDLNTIRDHYRLYPAVESAVDRKAKILCNKLYPRIKYRYDTGGVDYQRKLYIVANQERLVMEAKYLDYLINAWGLCL